MDKRGKILGWAGLIGGGLVSVAANLRSLWLPEYVDSGWRDLPQHAPSDPGALVIGIFLPLVALAGVEMVNHWTHLHRVLRYGVLGLVSLSAMIASFVHVLLVLMWYGQPWPIAVLITVSVDGLMILSGLALFTRTPDTDSAPDTPMDKSRPEIADALDSAPVRADMNADTDMDSVPSADSFAPDTVDTDTLHALVPATRDMDTEDTAPAPRPRRAMSTDSGWREFVTAVDRIDGTWTDREIAAKVLEASPATWPTVEAGRKAVARHRKSA